MGNGPLIIALVAWGVVVFEVLFAVLRPHNTCAQTQVSARRITYEIYLIGTLSVIYAVHALLT